MKKSSEEISSDDFFNNKNNDSCLQYQNQGDSQYKIPMSCFVANGVHGKKTARAATEQCQQK